MDGFKQGFAYSSRLSECKGMIEVWWCRMSTTATITGSFKSYCMVVHACFNLSVDEYRRCDEEGRNVSRILDQIKLYSLLWNHLYLYKEKAPKKQSKSCLHTCISLESMADMPYRWSYTHTLVCCNLVLVPIMIKIFRISHGNGGDVPISNV